ncbi:MAG TPA: pyridoxamine 5-phosphate oxidase [Mycobacteriales bacterium]
MARWHEVEREVPALAAAVRARFAVRKHATLATLRRDGAPRISGTEVEFGADVTLGSMPGALKARDLFRDPRLALHSPTVDPEPGNESAWPGEAKLAGTAVRQPDAEGGAHAFAVDLTEVVLTHVEGDRLVVESWHPSRGYERRERA